MTTPNGTPAAPVSGAPEVVVVATPPALVPDSPEYNAAMVAKADGQVPNAGNTEPPNGATPPAAPAETEKKEGDGTPPENTEVKPEGDKPADENKEGDKPTDEPVEAAPDFAKMFEDGSFAQAFNAETLDPKFRDGLAKALNVKGEDVDGMVAQFKAGQAALAREATANLFKAAGGQEAFEAAVAWGQKNLTPEQQQWYDAQFNGPNASDAVALLMQKAGASRDPSLHVPSGASGTQALQPFRDQSEVTRAMADPRYRTSEAYRNEVESRLRISTY
ncbi:capsid assembly protein [Cupriavidus nantongensis]|nr:hypothetical protein [Cupriavidus nantongensis]